MCEICDNKGCLNCDPNPDNICNECGNPDCTGHNRMVSNFVYVDDANQMVLHFFVDGDRRALIVDIDDNEGFLTIRDTHNKAKI